MGFNPAFKGLICCELFYDAVTKRIYVA